MRKKQSIKISVLGGGLWGTVLANHLAHNGHDVRLWEFFDPLAKDLEASRRHPHIPQFELHSGVRVTSDLSGAVKNSDIILVALPSAHVRPTAKKLAAALKTQEGNPCIVSASKGVEPKTLKTMGEILEEEIPAASHVYTISGPSFAREVAKNIPTALVIAGRDPHQAALLKSIFSGDRIKIELSSDRKGVELGGSLKNVLAIGCGILDGLNAGAAGKGVRPCPAGANTKAALITQGIAEMSMLVAALGGQVETVYGLSGIGDLMATGTSPESRNRGFGEKIGAGKSAAQALKEIPTVTEGVESAQSAHELVVRSKISCPLIESIWEIVHQGAGPEKVLDAMGFSRYAQLMIGK